MAQRHAGGAGDCGDIGNTRCLRDFKDARLGCLAFRNLPVVAGQVVDAGREWTGKAPESYGIHMAPALVFVVVLPCPDRFPLRHAAALEERWN
jgi:hypothetical protein